MTELERALAAGARIVGVNNRNLHTLAVDRRASDAVAERLPAGIVAVSESGLRTRQEMLCAATRRLPRLPDRRAIHDRPRPGRRAARGPVPVMTAIKFCGLTREQDVAAAAGAGATMMGFVLWSGSPRGVDVARARTLIAGLPPETTPVGVFVRPSSGEMRACRRDAGIRIAQVHGVASVDRPDRAGCELWLAATLAGDALDPPVAEEVTVLLDAGDRERFGGTGRTIDWGARGAHRRPPAGGARRRPDAGQRRRGGPAGAAVRR